MAKANDTSSTIDWIWLRDALVLAAAPLGSVALAKQRLREWLAAEKLPWSCKEWKGNNDNPRAVLAVTLAPCDPRFWSIPLKIDWEDNCARESFARGGAQALGISVSHSHLLALLPEEPREREQASGAGAWIAAEVGRMRAANKIPPDIRITDFARELEKRMGKAAARDKSLRPIKRGSIKNRLPAWGLWPVTSIK